MPPRGSPRSRTAAAAWRVTVRWRRPRPSAQTHCGATQRARRTPRTGNTRSADQNAGVPEQRASRKRGHAHKQRGWLGWKRDRHALQVATHTAPEARRPDCAVRQLEAGPPAMRQKHDWHARRGRHRVKRLASSVQVSRGSCRRGNAIRSDDGTHDASPGVPGAGAAALAVAEEVLRGAQVLLTRHSTLLFAKASSLTCLHDVHSCGQCMA